MAYSDASTDELIECCLNVTKTYLQAGGHNKAYQNEMRMESIREELRKRGIPIPEKDECSNKGIFNGPGAY